MTLYAVERVGDAVALARAFLFPVDAGRWLRLAVLALLVGGGGFGAGGGGSGASGAGGTGAGAGAEGAIDGAFGLSTAQVVAVVLFLVAVGVALALLVAVLASVAEFALVESLRTERVRLRAYFGRFWRRGLRLFALRFVVFLALVVVLAVLVGAVALPAALGAPLLAVVVALVAVPLALCTVVVGVAVDRFTVLFVVPAMLATDERSVLAGWRRCWPVFRAEWRQYLVYAGVAVVLALVTGVLVSVAVALVAVALLVPFGVVFLAGLALSTSLLPVGAVVAALAALGFVGSLIAVTALVQVPVVSFFRFHALLVLGDTDAALDVLGERRPPLG